MVNISKLSELAGKTLTVLKPTTRKVTTTLIFGAGTLAGSLITLNSSRNVTFSTQTEQPKNNVKTGFTSDEHERKAKVPSEIGEDGIVKADTVYSPYTKTKEPQTIKYMDKNGNIVQETSFDSGEMIGFTRYDAKGKFVGNTNFGSDGSYTVMVDDNGTPLHKKYDKNGRLLHNEYVLSNNEVIKTDYITNKDGSYTIKDNSSSITLDKNGRLIEEK